MENKEDFSIYENDADLIEALKNLSQSPAIQNLTTKDNLISCPFQFNDDNSFRECLFHRCMAYRTDGKIFWCARLEQRNCEDKMLHSVEMLEHLW